jgi:regulator of protease activity HflC (stomatin/prohibitin superfamily)
MIRAMARQAEAERGRRAKVIHAEGEKQAAQTLAEAAKILSKEPASLQLRYLQTRNDPKMPRYYTRELAAQDSGMARMMKARYVHLNN